MYSLCTIVLLLSCSNQNDRRGFPRYSTTMGETYTYGDGCSVTTTQNKDSKQFTIVFANSSSLSGHDFYFDIRFTDVNDKSAYAQMDSKDLLFFKNDIPFEFDGEHPQTGDAVYTVSYAGIADPVINVIDNDRFFLLVSSDLMVKPN